MGSEQEFKIHFGWNDFFENQLTNIAVNDQIVVAKVINEERNLYELEYGFGQTIHAQISGRMHFKASGRIHYPAVGDWVLAEMNPHNERAVIKFVFERKNMLKRKQIGASDDIQILASNVDVVFIATSLNANLNINRLYRYLTFVKDSKARPVILLTKSDLLEESSAIAEKVRGQFPDVDVHLLSSLKFEDATFLRDYLCIGKTSVIVGSSGVGKSTLVNFLIGDDRIKTVEVRAGDDKGRHTTTARSLYKTIYGGLIIDSPGVRELQFMGHDEGFKDQFADIEELVQTCRYTNCTHTHEPDCAVTNALESEELTYERWKSYTKIRGEVMHELRKENKWMLAEIRKTWKKRSIEARKRVRGM